MNRERELGRLKPWVIKAQGFSGWNLDDVEPKPIDPGPPWNYGELVVEYSRGARSASDMGTGGAEFLSKVGSSLPARVVATEEWTVNAPIAHHRLKPFGIDVVRCRSLNLPFQDIAFDLVLNRHEELLPHEA